MAAVTYYYSKHAASHAALARAGTEPYIIIPYTSETLQFALQIGHGNLICFQGLTIIQSDVQPTYILGI